MPANIDHSPAGRARAGRGVLLVMVPGMGMTAGDLDAQGLIAEARRCPGPVTALTVDPGLESYLDGSAEARLLGGIARAQQETGFTRTWLAGISLGCQGILRCVRARPGLAEGLMLLTPYMASTGLVADISRSGGLRRWAAANAALQGSEQELLFWLATTPLAALPRILVGRALADRFATTATLVAELLPAGDVTDVQGEHDWAAWRSLWRLMLSRDPFRQDARAIL
jgi:pimeloyl-ACP methyl ester carboxylesterase